MKKNTGSAPAVNAKNKSPLTKILAITGTLLILFPVIAPLLFGILGLIRRLQYLQETGPGGETLPLFNFDWLMPAELFPMALAGGIMLMIASFRSRTLVKLIGSALIAMIILPVGGQLVAIWTGLATGATEPEGWPWMLVIGFFIAYGLSLIVSGISGILLIKHLFKDGKA